MALGFVKVTVPGPLTLDHIVVTVPLGELDDVKGKPNRQLIKDYCYWLHNWC